VVGALALTIVRARLDGWLQTRLEAGLARALGGRASVSELDLSLLGRSLELRGLEFAGPGAPEDLTGRVETLTARFTWSGLFALGSGRVRLAELRVERPEIDLDRAFVEARPSPGDEKRPLDVRIDRLELSGGRFGYRDRTLELDVGAEDVRLTGAWSESREAVDGYVAFRSSVLGAPLARPLPLEVDSRFRWAGQRIEWTDTSIRGPGLELTARPSLDWSEGTVFEGPAAIRADLDVLRDWLAPDFPEVRGELEWDCVIAVAAGDVRLHGPARASSARFSVLEAERLTADTEYTAGRLRLSTLRAEAYGGTLEGEVDVELGPEERFIVEARGANVAADRLLAALGVPLPASSRAELELRLAGDPGDPGTWNGDGRAALAAVRSSRLVPLAGRGEFDIVDGRVTVDARDVEAGAARFAVRVEFGLNAADPRRFLHVEGDSLDAGSTREATLRVLDAFSVELPALCHEPLRGSGRFVNRTAFGTEDTIVELELALRDGAFSGESFDEGELRLISSRRRLRVDRLLFVRGPQRVEGSLTLRTDTTTLDELEVHVTDLETAPWIERFALTDVAAGRASGHLLLERGPTGLSGEGNVHVTDVSWLGETIDEITSPVAAEGEVVQLTGVRAVGPAATVQGRVRLDLTTREVDILVDEARLRLERLAAVQRAGLPSIGSVDLEGELRVDGEGELSGELRFLAEDAALAGQEFGGGRGSIRFANGHARVEAATVSGAPWSAEVDLELGEPYTIDAVFELQDSTFGLPLEGVPALARLTGSATLRGALSMPESLEGHVDLDRLELVLGGHTLRTTAGLDLRLDKGEVRIEDFRVRGEATELAGAARWHIVDRTLAGRLVGDLDLGICAAPWEELRAQGRLELAIDLGGTVDAPKLRGKASVDRGRVRLLGFPHTLEQVGMELVFEGSRVQVDSLRAFLGGGVVEASGDIDLVGVVPGSYRLEFEGSNVRLAYPEGFRGIYEGRTLLTGDAERAVLSGQLRMLRGVYDEEFDFLGMIGLGVRGFEPTEESRLPEAVALDVSLTAGDNVWVRNSSARIESSLTLQFGGNMARPEVTGRLLLLEGGRLRFRDVDYDIVSGTIDLLEPERIDPYVNLRATTEIDDYEIELHIEGTADRFNYQLSSSPSLTQQDIIALLATGQTLEQSGSAAGAFTGDVATNYFAGALTSTFERQLRRTLGLERLEIDPLVVGEDTDTTARVTIGKEVTDDVMIVASSDIGSSERQLYQIEWRASRKFRLAAGRDTTGGIGGEFRYLDRFWLGRRPTWPDTMTAQPGGAAAGAALPRVGVVAIRGVDEDSRRELLKRLPFAAGDPFRRSDLFEGAESIRRHYVKLGRIGTSVASRHAPVEGTDEMTVDYTVLPGPRVDVVFTGLAKKQEKRVRERLQDFWVESILSEDLAWESAEEVRKFLLERGYYTADVGITQRVEDGVERLQFDVDPGKLVRVERVDLEGADSLQESRIRQQILSRRGMLAGRPVLLPKLLDEDRRAIEALYANEGHLRARIAAPRIRLSADGQRAAVGLIIEEGPRFTIEKIEVEPEGGAFDARRLAEWSGLEVGQPISPARLLTAESAMRAAMDRHGYPDARSRGKVELRESTAVVRFEADPGAFKRVASIEIRGNELTRTRIIQRELRLEPGDPISRGRLLESQHNLYRLGIFRNVRLGYEPLPGGEPDAYKLTVDVEEDRPLILRLGAGFDSEAGPKGSFSLAHRNLGGWNRTLAFQGRLSDIEERGQLSLEEPRLGGREIKAVANVRIEKQEEVSFTEETIATGLRLEKQLGRKKTGFLRYTFQEVDITDVDDPLAPLLEKTENVVLGDAGLVFAYDGRDDPFQTRNGGYHAVELRVFDESILSEEEFVKTFFRSSNTHTFTNGHSYASAIRVGLAEPYGSTSRIPVSERFFAGGDSTVRGFERDTLGPSVDDAPIGGEASLVINQEWRFPLWKQLGGVVFYDAGNVYLTVDDFDPTDLRHVLGAGLRIATPIGPIRLEYGRKLDREDGESSGELFLAVGLAF
jgi:outer membrane protein insertion porin family